MNDKKLPAGVHAAAIGAVGRLYASSRIGNSTLPPTGPQDLTQPSQLFGTLYRGRWLVLGSTAFFLLIGIVYATIARPVFRSGLLIQVQPNQDAFKDSIGTPQAPTGAGGNGGLGATTEIEVLKSRMVIARAVENLRLYIEATPHYLPVIGRLIAAHSSSLSTPLLGGRVYGTERISVPLFEVPKTFKDKPFDLKLGANGTYTLKRAGSSTTPAIDLAGKVGTLLHGDTPDGPVKLLVSNVDGEPGASFTLVRRPKVATAEQLQKMVRISEQGTDSGIISATLDGDDPLLISSILNEIGDAYVEQNAKSKSEAADKSIQFLDEQLPQRKAQLEEAENRYNAFRAEYGAFNTSVEGTALLQQTLADQKSIVELKERRDDMLSRFSSERPAPALQAVNSQIAEAEGALAALAARTHQLPLIEQNVIQLQRDVQVDSDLYTSLLNARQQLTLVRAARVPNVRILDRAVPEEFPIKPMRGLVIAGSGVLGALVGVLLAFVRRRVLVGVEDPLDIEWDTGLPIFATVLRSRLTFEKLRKAPEGAQLVLAPSDPKNEASVESLRAFRTTLQFALEDTAGGVVLLTGPTAGVGKSFLSANLAILSKVTEKRILLIDADSRKGHLHAHFRVPRGPGLVDVVLGSHPVENAIHRNVTPGVDLLTAGTFLRNSSDIFLYPGLEVLIRSLGERYDMVVIDGPPILLAADAIALAKVADAVFLVARHGVSTLPEIRESARRLALAGVSIRGVVFNDFQPGPGRSGYAYTGYPAAPWNRTAVEGETPRRYDPA